MQDILEHHEEEQPSLLRKILLGIIGVFLLLLTLSLTLFSGPVTDIFRGQVQSTALDNGQLAVGNISVTFENDVHLQLRDLFLQEEGEEIAACLLGTKQGNNYVVDDLYYPQVLSRSFAHVSFVPCSQETLIIFHTHPYKSCLASEQDLVTLRDTQKINPEVLMMIMCEPSRFAVIS